MSHDTPPEVRAQRLAVLAALRPEERLLEALRMSDLVAALTSAGRRFRVQATQPSVADHPAEA